jgi:hypothetical protein
MNEQRKSEIAFIAIKKKINKGKTSIRNVVHAQAVLHS